MLQLRLHGLKCYYKFDHESNDSSQKVKTLSIAKQIERLKKIY